MKNKKIINVAIFASGNGSNFQAIVDSYKRGFLRNIKIALLVCDRPQAYVIKRAQKANINCFLVERKQFQTRNKFENFIIQKLKKEKIDLICLAGYMRVLSPKFVLKYKNKILNIHPALLPAFKGENGIKDAFNYAVKITGVTVHFVDNGVDTGPIILQEAVGIKERDTLKSLEEKIHKIEHIIYPKAIRIVADGKVRIIGRKVKILNK